MTARILVVDDVLANVRLLEARLSAEYFEIRTASNGLEALKICARAPFDVILLDVMMPGMDGFDVCRRLKNDPATAHVPVVLVTALDQPGDRVKGLEAGADDFLTKPVDEIALVARVRSLARLKLVIDELRKRAESSASFGLHPALADGTLPDGGVDGQILLVEDRPNLAERFVATIGQFHSVDLETTAETALARAVGGRY